MIVYRLCLAKHQHDLSGRGAEISGGRWNGKGTAMLYTSQSRALCTAEIAVHTPLGIVPKNYKILTIEIPNSVSKKVLPRDKLPRNWREYPHPKSTQLLGDDFVRKNQHLVLKVPSVVVEGDFNFLINPIHEDFNRIKMISADPFRFDERLFKR